MYTQLCTIIYIHIIYVYIYIYIYIYIQRVQGLKGSCRYKDAAEQFVGEELPSPACQTA